MLAPLPASSSPRLSSLPSSLPFSPSQYIYPSLPFSTLFPPILSLFQASSSPRLSSPSLPLSLPPFHLSLSWLLYLPLLSLCPPFSLPSYLISQAVFSLSPCQFIWVILPHTLLVHFISPSLSLCLPYFTLPSSPSILLPLSSSSFTLSPFYIFHSSPSPVLFLSLHPSPSTPSFLSLPHPQISFTGLSLSLAMSLPSTPSNLLPN